MKKKPYYLKKYKEWMKSRRLPEAGLCNNLYRDKMLRLFIPYYREKQRLKRDGYCEIFWAAGVPTDSDGEFRGFTTLRQTIVLFLAAMNNEL